MTWRDNTARPSFRYTSAGSRCTQDRVTSQRACLYSVNEYRDVFIHFLTHPTRQRLQWANQLSTRRSDSELGVAWKRQHRGPSQEALVPS